MRGVLLAFVGAWATAACAAAPPSQIPFPSGSGLRPLEADALRALLSDAYVTPVQPAGLITGHSPGEIFRSDGAYVRIPNRTRQFGTFDIQGNLVCVQGADFPRLCRQIMPRPDGTYVLVDPLDGSTMLMTIGPLQ